MPRPSHSQRSPSPEAKRDSHPRESESSSRPKASEQDSAGPGLSSLTPGRDFSQGTFDRHASLLADPRLSRPMYARQRAEIMRGLQRDYGNAYVQRLVERISAEDGKAGGNGSRDLSTSGVAVESPYMEDAQDRGDATSTLPTFYGIAARREATVQESPLQVPPQQGREALYYPDTNGEVREQAGEEGPVQRIGSVGKGVLSVGEGFVNATVGPFVNPRIWSEYFQRCDDLWNKRTPADDLMYGGNAMRVLQIVSESTNQVALVATSIALVFSIVGAALAPMGGAPLAAIGTVAGIVAAIAHGITLILRSITLARDLYTLRQFPKAAEGEPKPKERALLRAKIWRDGGGMLASALGVIFGGLAGGFGGTNVLAGAASSGDVAKAVASGGLSQMGGTAGDIGAAISEGRGTRMESHAEQRQPAAALQGPAVAPEESGEESEGGIPVSEVLASLSEIDTGAREEEARGDEAISEEREAEKVVASMQQNARKLEAESQKLEAESGNLDKQDKVVEQAAEGVKKSKGAKSEEAVAKAEEGVEKGEEKLGVEHEATIEEIEPPVPQQAEESFIPAPAQQAAVVSPGPAPQKATVVSQGPKPQKGVKRDSVEESDDGTVQRAVGKKIKGFFGRLFGRVVNVGKRVRKLWAKAKGKLTGFLVKALGIREPAQELNAELDEAKAEIPQTIEADQEGQEAVGAVLEQTGQIRDALESARQGD